MPQRDERGKGIMKVYVVEFSDRFGGEVLGAFSTREKAVKYVEKFFLEEWSNSSMEDIVTESNWYRIFKEHIEIYELEVDNAEC